MTKFGKLETIVKIVKGVTVAAVFYAAVEIAALGVTAYHTSKVNFHVGQGNKYQIDLITVRSADDFEAYNKMAKDEYAIADSEKAIAKQMQPLASFFEKYGILSNAARLASKIF